MRWLSPGLHSSLTTALCVCQASSLSCNPARDQVRAEQDQGWEAAGDDPGLPESLFLPTGPGAADSQTWASCMTTSLQLAQECLREGLPEPSEPPQPLEGLEMFAQTIETGEQAPDLSGLFLDPPQSIEPGL